jgi:hypothetical protein
MRVILFIAGVFLPLLAIHAKAEEPFMASELLFPVEQNVNHHGSCVVELPNGDVLVTWNQGAGERGHNIAIMGARKLKRGGGAFTERFVMADTPKVPDNNASMVVDGQARLWIFWSTLLARDFETAQMHYKVSTNFCMPSGPPEWDLMQNLFLEPDKVVAASGLDAEVEVPQPGNFEDVVRGKFKTLLGADATEEQRARVEEYGKMAGDRLVRRMGWFGRAHSKILEDGRMILGLYSDGFNFSLAAISDDSGATWHSSEPIVGWGNVQPSFAQKQDGTLVAYFRDNGPAPKRVMVAESRDRGESWGPVYDHPLLPNPGSGLEVANLSDGLWICVYNDLEEARYSLAVSLSDDEGKTWKWTRHLERMKMGDGVFHYPSIVEGRNGRLHVSYSYQLKHPTEQKSIKYATFNREWVKQGD